MIVYGKQICLYILENYANIINEIYLQKEIEKKLFYKISALNKKIVRVDSKKAQAMAKGGNHQGFLLDIRDLSFSSFKDIKDENFLLVLHNITDVGNIGAIIRSAYIFGVDGVVITSQKHFNLEPVVRSSSGALLEMPVVLYPNCLDLINELKMSGFVTYGADLNGKNLKDIKFKDNKKALFLGSEGDGIPGKILSKLDKKISINMVRDFNSLNVSAAAAIICDRIANG